MRQQLLNSFFHRSATTLSPFGGQRWYSMIPDWPTPAKPLESAALALAVSRMGLDLKDSRYTQESLRLYTQGLKQVQLALWDPKRMYADETLGACMLLTMYEVVECPSKGRLGYVSHHNGCARLVQLRGPKAHIDGLGHSIFLQFRYISVS
jgi:transcription factor-like protein